MGEIIDRDSESGSDVAPTGRVSSVANKVSAIAAKHLVINRAAPCQRRFQRMTAPIDLVIAGRSYRSVNFSLGGFRLSDCDLPIAVGECVDALVALNFQGFAINVAVRATMIWRTPDHRTAGFAFDDMGGRERDLLEYFARGLLSGEMSQIGSVIQRIDTPVTPVVIDPYAAGVATAVPQIASRRRWVSGVYLGIGSLLAGYIGLMFYSQVWRLDVQSAVVALPQEVVVVPEQAIVKAIHVGIGSQVKANALMARVQEFGLEREFADAKIRVGRAELEVRNAERGYAAEAANAPFYSDVTSAKLVQAEQRVLSAQAATKEATAELSRAKQLMESGFFSASAVDRAMARLSQEKASLEQAQAERRIAAGARAVANAGVLFDGNRLTGKVEARKRELRSARDNLEIAEHELVAVKQRMARQEIIAPFDAVVKRVEHAVGATVNRGDTLLVLEQHGAVPQVMAFLTQDEIARVQLGSVGYAYIPALDRRIDVKVIRVDRQFGFTPDAQSLPRWQELGHRDAVVRLEILDHAQASALTTGMPVQVNLPRGGPSQVQRVFARLGI